jgi:hypothetical protein
MHIDKEILKMCLTKQLSKKQPNTIEQLPTSQPSLFPPSETLDELIIDDRYRKLLVYVIDHDPTSEYVFYGKKTDYI